MKSSSYINVIDSLDPNDKDLEEKLMIIARRMNEERKENSASRIDDRNIVDPADEFACEGCQ